MPIKKCPYTSEDISIVNHSSNINNVIYLFFGSVHWKIYEVTYSIQDDLFSLNLISMNFMIT